MPPSGTRTECTTSIVAGAGSPTPTHPPASSVVRRGFPTLSVSLDISARTNSTPHSISATTRPATTQSAWLIPSTRRSPTMPPSAHPPPGCCRITMSCATARASHRDSTMSSDSRAPSTRRPGSGGRGPQRCSCSPFPAPRTSTKARSSVSPRSGISIPRSARTPHGHEAAARMARVMVAASPSRGPGITPAMDSGPAAHPGCRNHNCGHTSASPHRQASRDQPWSSTVGHSPSGALSKPSGTHRSPGSSAEPPCSHSSGGRHKARGFASR